jgi:hypothetical protein
LVDHLIIPEPRETAETHVIGCFIFNRQPNQSELGSCNVQVRRYRRTRPIPAPEATGTEKFLLRLFGIKRKIGKTLA